jgi:hypothetical protein
MSETTTALPIPVIEPDSIGDMQGATLNDEPTTVEELVAWGKENPISWYVPDIILEDGVHVLHGLEECFKTTFMLQLHDVLTRGG